MFELDVQDRVARLALANPPVNAFSRAWGDRFHAMLDELDRRDDWVVLHIRSNLRVFSAGGDLKLYANRLDDPHAGKMLAAEAAYYQKLLTRIERMPRISLVEIGGVAAGGGFELALACDLRIASEDARIGLPEVGVGLLPAAGGTQRTARLCGRGNAIRVVIGAELMSGAEAHRIGLVEWVAPAAELATKATEIARHFASQPPATIAAAKRCIDAAFDPARDGFAVEVKEAPALMHEEETRRRIRDFMERRAAKNAAR